MTPEEAAADLREVDEMIDLSSRTPFPRSSLQQLERMLILAVRTYRLLGEVGHAEQLDLRLSIVRSRLAEMESGS